MIKSFFTVSSMTGLSRTLGYIRDMLFAMHLGTGPVADAFFVAFKLPNTFRRIFAEGALNAAFVPLFSNLLEKDEKEARNFTNNSFIFLALVLIILTTVCLIFMPFIIRLIAPGFTIDPAKFDLTVTLSRVCFSYLMCISLMSLMGGVLNTLRHYLIPAFAPALLNIVFVGVLLTIVPHTQRPGFALSVSVLIAGILQLLIVLVKAHQMNHGVQLVKPALNEHVRKLYRKILPGIISAGAGQINIFVGTIIASLSAGAVSYIYYADRLYQLPLGLIGIAFGTILLPTLSNAIAKGEIATSQQQTNKCLLYAGVLVFPASIALMVIPLPIVRGLFEWGAFSAASAKATAIALSAFAFGLPAYVLSKIFLTLFFAHGNTQTPMKYALISISFNIITMMVLYLFMGYVGIALGTSLAGYIHLFCLVFGANHRGYWTPAPHVIHTLKIQFMNSCLMGIGLWSITLFFPLFHTAEGWIKTFTLALLVGMGLCLYGMATFITKMPKKLQQI